MKRLSFALACLACAGGLSAALLAQDAAPDDDAVPVVIEPEVIQPEPDAPDVAPAQPAQEEDDVLRELGGRPDEDAAAEPQQPDDDLLQELGGDPAQRGFGAEEENPLLRIGRRMRESEERIAQADPGEETQTIQRRIVQDLDELIEMARRQQSSQSQSQNRNQQEQQQQTQAQQPNPNNSGGQRNNNQATQAAQGASRGAPERAQLSAAELERAAWGHLPGRARQLMSAGFSIPVLPAYEEMVEDYYRTLAEEGSRTGRSR